MSNDWKDEVLDALTINWHLSEENHKNPRLAVSDLVRAEVSLALDPTVSQAAQLMINERDVQWRDAIIDTCRRHGCMELGNEILEDMEVAEA
jgi:hypothetical protein